MKDVAILKVMEDEMLGVKVIVLYSLRFNIKEIATILRLDYNEALLYKKKLAKDTKSICTKEEALKVFLKYIPLGKHFEPGNEFDKLFKTNLIITPNREMIEIPIDIPKDIIKLYILKTSAAMVSRTLLIKYNVVRAMYQTLKKYDIPTYSSGQVGDLVLKYIDLDKIKEYLNGLQTT